MSQAKCKRPRICLVFLDLENPISNKKGGANEFLLYWFCKNLGKKYELHLIVNLKTKGRQPSLLNVLFTFRNI
jgi:hypothetical protein